MKAGAAQLDITPPPGRRVELSGFVARAQPALGVHDVLFARALYVVDTRGGHVLWLHADLVGFECADVAALQSALHARLGLAAHEICVSATHTHSAPATLRLLNCGEYDAEYVAFVQEQLVAAATQAVQTAAPAELMCAEGRCTLAVDRRGRPTRHTDPRVGVLAFRRREACSGAPRGAYIAVLANYAMHNVALGHENRLISRDIAGWVAEMAGQRLPGSPIVLLTNGGAGNLNPPAVGNDFGRMQTWADQLAGVVVDTVERATRAPERSIPDAQVHTAATTLALPSAAAGAADLDAIAARHLARLDAKADEVSVRSRDAVQRWRALLRDDDGTRAAAAAPATDLPRTRGSVGLACPLPLQVVSFGPVSLACFGAEVFSGAAEDLRARTGRPVYVVSYANGVIGYLAPRTAHAEGGYETDADFIFYGRAPLAPGGYEQALDAVAKLIP